MKVEKTGAIVSLCIHEAKVYKNLNLNDDIKQNGIPEALYFGVDKDNIFLVIELLGILHL